jgi:hypothetical protein
MKRWSYFLFAFGALLSSSVSAQDSGGAGVNLYTPNPQVRIGFVSADQSHGRAVRLAALVVWRGTRPSSFAASTERDAAAVRDSMANLRAARRRNRAAGGTCMPSRCAWVEFDPDQRIVHLLGRTFRAPARDSTLVLLVDGADAPRPTIRSFVIASSVRTRASSETRTSERMLRETQTEMEFFRGIARSDARINEFVRGWGQFPASKQ